MFDERPEVFPLTIDSSCLEIMMLVGYLGIFLEKHQNRMKQSKMNPNIVLNYLIDKSQQCVKQGYIKRHYHWILKSPDIHRSKVVADIRP